MDEALDEILDEISEETLLDDLESYFTNETESIYVHEVYLDQQLFDRLCQSYRMTSRLKRYANVITGINSLEVTESRLERSPRLTQKIKRSPRKTIRLRDILHKLIY